MFYIFSVFLFPLRESLNLHVLLKDDATGTFIISAVCLIRPYVDCEKTVTLNIKLIHSSSICMCIALLLDLYK